MPFAQNGRFEAFRSNRAQTPSPEQAEVEEEEERKKERLSKALTARFVQRARGLARAGPPGSLRAVALKQRDAAGVLYEDGNAQRGPTVVHGLANRRSWP